MKELITLKELAEKYGVSRQTIHNWRKDPSFPKPRVLARRHSVWDPVVVDRWYNGDDK